MSTLVVELFWNALVRGHTQLRGPVGRPARRGNLQYTSVIRNTGFRIERWIGPLAKQLGRTNGIGKGSSLNVNRISNGRNFSGFRIEFAVSTPHHLINLFGAFAVLGRDFDNLNAIEISAVWIFQVRER